MLTEPFFSYSSLDVRKTDALKEEGKQALSMFHLLLEIFMSWVEISGLLGDFIETSLTKVLSSDTKLARKP